ncbi:histidine phosphatase family protein [Nocardia sp. alder85J]|uniref:histidine phosphatase family protein n=1 Tax=Nocardia sp. alder85J TaxID=2862949 RepID=UPI001CD340CF|nr:histidine phosphatase family protein [Nocardia sp. alder85J]MCX4090936.1 histidine phosphatase family protein [Nocardia sp. alder85J]
MVRLIRHGESEGNIGLPSSGGTTPLTARGHEQARRVAGAFDVAPSLIVVSPLRRAQQTAQPTIERFPGVRREQWAVQEFRFLPGFADDVVTTESLAPHLAAYWERADPFERHPGKESFFDLLDRAEALLDDLAAQPDGLIAVFSHGTFLRAVLYVVLGKHERSSAGMSAFHAYHEANPIDNGVIVELGYPGPNIVRVDNSHLDG